MKPKDAGGFHKPFERLAELVADRRLAPAPSPERPAAPARVQPPPSERELFIDAMRGVRRLPGRGSAAGRPGPQPAAAGRSGDEEGIEHLERLVAGGEGFVVADTPDYMEGVGRRAPAGITRRLHRGDFALQGHVDLHGLSADQAQAVFEDFMRQSLAAGHRSVLVIHGRGLSSPAAPVLKSRLAQWLTRGPWRKWVIAFTSARGCDGGAGATYLLLRRRPLTQRRPRPHGG
jgi:DNA-nicking Smr family endonuclease